MPATANNDCCLTWSGQSYVFVRAASNVHNILMVRSANTCIHSSIVLYHSGWITQKKQLQVCSDAAHAATSCTLSPRDGDGSNQGL